MLFRSINGQRWTDGQLRYSDDGLWDSNRNTDGDLVEYLGPVLTTEQSAENERLKAEIERLKAELQAERQEFHRQLQRSQEAHTTDFEKLHAEHRGERQAFRLAIREILEALE